MADDSYPRIPQPEYDQALKEARQGYIDIFSVYDKYGYNVFNQHNIQRALDVAEQFAQKVRGKNITIKAPALETNAH